MTSVATAGYQGVFKIASTAMIQVNSIELQVNGATYDVTVMSGTTSPLWKAFIAGLLDATLKVIGNLDFVNDAVQLTLWNALGTVVTWTFSPSASTHNFTGSAIIMSVPIKLPVNNAETVEFDFQVTGAVSYS